MIIVSVVRNFDMYNRLVKDNYFNQGAKFVYFDNTKENKGIPERYNNFLDSYDYTKPDWFIFCHEDWEIKENWQNRFASLDKDSLYGPVGAAGFRILNRKTLIAIYGRIINSNKDCSKIVMLGKCVKTGKEVQTFDCQCLIVHSDLIKKYNLRFDKNLSFDLYIEDFCANAKESFNIPSRIMQLYCQHYSFGSVQLRIYEQLNYLRDKYKNAKLGYCSTVTGLYFGNTRNFDFNILVDYLRQKSASVFFQKKIINSDRICIKICKIKLPQFIAKVFRK